MEAAIRFSPHSTSRNPRFLIVDVAGNRLQLCEIKSSKTSPATIKPLAVRDKLPNFTAFDWSKVTEPLVAIGSASGEATLINIHPDQPFHGDSTRSFSIKHQRKCNSIAFSSKNALAAGLDRVRNDFCMNIYDINASTSPGRDEPYRKLASSEAVYSIKFFPSSPDELVAGVSRQYIGLFDLRDSVSTRVAQYTTRQVNNIAVDPLDENYFISAGSSGDPVVSVWDRRYASKMGGPSTPSGERPSGAIIELRPAIDNKQASSIWSLRFSGEKRGCFGVLSSSGEIRIVEMAQHSVKPGLQTVPPNPLGGTPWISDHYVRYSHNLAYPTYSHHHTQSSTSRLIAYDFIPRNDNEKHQSAIALRPNRDVEIRRVPCAPARINITAMDEIYVADSCIRRVGPSEGHLPIAEELRRLQDEKYHQLLSPSLATGDNKDSAPKSSSSLSMGNFGHKSANAIPRLSSVMSSRDMHEELLQMGFPQVRTSLTSSLKQLGIQRQRCKEGYLFDADRNKEIVKNDPWLVELWDTVQRFEAMSKDRGMASESVDLSYLGISAILNNTFDEGKSQNRIAKGTYLSKSLFSASVKEIVHANEYPKFQGAETAFPEHRQLCLALCGWKFSIDTLRTRCLGLIETGEHYKAIVLAVIRGYKSLALELLRFAIQQKAIQNIGLGAVIACESVNKEQRDQCAWMAEETDDPYLKALLAYFISGDWNSVTAMTQLALADRIGVALKYLDDERLTYFIKSNTAKARSTGNIEGIILTGLDEKAMDLFQKYITKFDDLQTAVLVMAFSTPLYLVDARYEAWKDTYFMHMQAWKTFIERTRFIAQHNRRAAIDGKTYVPAPKKSIALRCQHCMASLAPSSKSGKHAPDVGASFGSTMSGFSKTPPKTAHKPAASSGVTCPHCGRHVPRCAICLMWLGTPDPLKENSRAPNPSSSQHAQQGARDEKKDGEDRRRATEVEMEDLMARQVVFCITCNHGFHGGHAKDWFMRHQTCPVPDCQCMCGMLD
ncbi:hypothetical protein K402DRAFT_464592 [Aulographum hederae CBS 113979]|uniref:Uncharacterized protein n=1 Tax=Aulographum hederae CBS 113979 TaxID=1176131 RepID=A0A6G1GWE1_9PEZI|nr:hypothetical protein K402DRAFT_464592 [Aulographum hederae CBS 113979]